MVNYNDAENRLRELAPRHGHQVPGYQDGNSGQYVGDYYNGVLDRNPLEPMGGPKGPEEDNTVVVLEAELEYTIPVVINPHPVPLRMWNHGLLPARQQ